jgi:uncharacterized protein (TIGR03000 family)
VYYLSPPYYWWGPVLPCAGESYGPASYDWVGLDDPMPTIPLQMCGKVEILAPREAEVAFNGVKIKRKSERQSFDTPKLTSGEKFHYVVTATVMVDGKKETVKKTVVVEAGKKAQADFRELTLVLAKK